MSKQTKQVELAEANGVVGKAKIEKVKKNRNKRHNCSPTSRTDVKNIVDSINMTLHDYGIAFDFNERQDLICVHDDVPSLIAQAQQEAVERGRQRTIEIVDMMRKDASLASRLNHPSDVYYYLLKSLKKEQE